MAQHLPEPFSRHSLAFRLGLIIVALELAIFLAIGLVYVDIYESHADEELSKRLHAVSDLLSRGVVAYDTVNDEQLLARLVGRGFEEAMIVGFTGVVYHATDQGKLGQHIRDIEHIQAEWFGLAREGGFVREVEENGRQKLISAYPVRNAADGAAFVFAYISVDKHAATEQSREFLRALLLASAVGVAVTSLAIILCFRRLVFSHLQVAAGVMQRITSGELSSRMPDKMMERPDELGFMARSLNEMTASMDRSVTELEKEIHNRSRAEAALSRAKDELEERVRQRTEDLDNTNRKLMREIEERTAAEAALRESHERLQGILDHSPSAISLVDAHGRFIMANRQFLRLFAPDTKHVQGKARNAMLGPENAEAMRVLEDKALAERAPVGDEESIVLDGEVRTYMTTAFPLLDDAGHPFAACAIRTDVSERKWLEAESMRAGQLAALGELAAGVAHEINNPLNGIVNYAEIIREEDDLETLHELSAKIILEGERVSRIVSKLLAFARSRSDTFEPVNVRDVVDDALQLLENSIRRDNVIVEVDVDESLPRIKARDQEIRQVLLNLMTNALYAVARQEEREERLMRIEAETVQRNEGAFVDIRVIDNGPGIPPAIMDRILSPFFSTKPSNEGTGLGLSISHAIMKEHSGRLVIESEEHAFTRATASIPIYDKACFP